MTDISAGSELPDSPKESIHTDASARARLRKRYAAEARFKYIGLGAVLLAGAFLVLLLSTVIGEAINAFTYYYTKIKVEVPAVENTGSEADLRKELLAIDFNGAVRNAVRAEFPYVKGRRDRRALNGLLSAGAGTDLRRMVLADPSLGGKTVDIDFMLSDFGDLYMKGLVTDRTSESGNGAPLRLSRTGRHSGLVHVERFQGHSCRGQSDP